MKPAEQRADMVEPRRREFQPGGCVHYRLNSLQEVRRSTYLPTYLSESRYQSPAEIVQARLSLTVERVSTRIGVAQAKID